MALIYVEYITPKPGVALRDFHRIAGKQQVAWDSAFAEDELLLNLARTWRVGPLPPYVCIWHQPRADLEQLDRWERVFESGSVDDVEDPINLVIRIDHAGCYRSLLPPARGRAGRYYAEFFEERDDAGADAVRELYRARAARHDGLRLHLLARRIGHLGPDSRATSRSGAARRTRRARVDRRGAGRGDGPRAWSPPASTGSWGGRSSGEGGGRAAAAGEEGARDGNEWRRSPATRATRSGCSRRGLSRREALRLTASAGLLAGLPAVLAACGDSDDDGDATSAASPTTAAAETTEAPATSAPTSQPAGTTTVSEPPPSTEASEPATSARRRRQARRSAARRPRRRRPGGVVQPGARLDVRRPVALPEHVRPAGTRAPRLVARAVPRDGVGGQRRRHAVDVRLRPDVTWHDGSPFTAEDVIFTIRSWGDEKHIAHANASLLDLDGLKAVDPLTLEIPLKSPNARLLDGFTGQKRS